MIQEKAAALQGAMHTKGYAIDPATLLLIVQLVMQVFKMLQECKKTPEEAVKVLHRPTLGQLLRLRRLVHNTLRERGVLYAAREDLLHAMEEMGKTMQAHEVQSCYADSAAP
jgi:hypothetical protein